MKVGDKVIAHHDKGVSIYCEVISVTEDEINLYVINGNYKLTLGVVQIPIEIQNRGYNEVICFFIKEKLGI